MKLTLPYPPTANLYWRVFRGRPVKSTKARHYQNAVRLRWLTARPRGAVAMAPMGPVSVTVDAYRPRALGDLDNTLKVLLDALKGIAYVDDAQVVELHARRHDDKANPRVEVVVLPAGNSAPTEGSDTSGQSVANPTQPSGL